MDSIINLPLDDRRALFSETANRRAMTEAVVEKDFWVCYVLQKLIESSTLDTELWFKGGTSLSKVFGLIDRFSEDIDLVLAWESLTDEDPFAERSNRKQERFLKTVRERARTHISEVILPELQNRISGSCTAEVDQDDSQAIIVTYPRTFESDYLRNEIKLEIGPVALSEPSSRYTIRPYAAEEFPDRFDSPECTPNVVCAERTFWEKAVILHQEAHRSPDNPQPPRYSRHFYDMMRLAQSDIKGKALSKRRLLDTIVDFNTKFYSRAWARYDLAASPTFCLVPPEHVERSLRRDYDAMREMIYGERPTFDEILEHLNSLETEINTQEVAG